MAWLMARLCSKNMGYINWEPYVPIMYTRFARTFALPVHFRQKTIGKSYKIDVFPICMWIVCTLHTKGSSFNHLEKFMQTLESYFHPANSGRY